MKKFLVSLVVLMFAGLAGAEVVDLNLGAVKLHMPFNDGSVVGLLDLNHESAAMTGFETTVGSIANVVSISVGGVTSELGQGTPYASFGYILSESELGGLMGKIGFGKFDFGVFGGYDFNLKSADFYSNCRVGLKLSTEILSSITK
jgi:hypothetical protein